MMINLIKHYWFIITLFLLTAIATLSLWPAEYLPQVPGSDKSHHFISYGALILPLALRKPKHWLWIALGFAAFSGAIELIQPYVNRYGEWLDMLANVMGLACGTILAKIITHFFSGSSK
ncbi:MULTISPECIES: VanZ family protein [Colwellia]|uniref:Teicoplanin resistance protein VanZ n=2 Tax=Colwellia TaxID=28228 RepID=A0ABQ0MRS0_9GAMM|nr:MULTISPECIES: VanZ family protein [Colwellia]GAW95068.1 teicoplanin resistance protein VanZ [Colwellia marinimaniae]